MNIKTKVALHALAAFFLGGIPAIVNGFPFIWGATACCTLYLLLVGVFVAVNATITRRARTGKQAVHPERMVPRATLVEVVKRERALMKRNDWLQDAVVDLMYQAPHTPERDMTWQRVLPFIDARFIDEMEGGDRVVRRYEQEGRW